MAGKDVLTQEEIDALLRSVDSGAVATGSDEPAPENVRPYDLTSQDRIVRGRLPTIELLGEKFARQLRADLQELLRYPVSVGAGGVQVLPYSEFAASLYVPTSITLVKMPPLKGPGLVTLDAKLVFRMVDQYFGGDGRTISIEGRDFTPTEKRIIARVLELVFADLAAAWSEVLPISLQTIGQEINPSLVNVFGSDEVMMVNTFFIELDSGGGELHIVIPYAALEPYKRVLDATAKGEQTERDAHWSPALQRALLNAEVPLRCSVAEKSIKLRELLSLRVGDVIPLEVPELHVVLAGEVPAFAAKLGESRGNMALEFVDNVARN
ncbi:MAG TPA: flagellar motor switch protein FliM [Pseudomonadales bacterium]